MDAERLLNKIAVMCNFAERLAELSTCKRNKVAAIVFPIDCSRVYSIGYNGPVAGAPNDDCNGVEGKCGCVHAEANAVLKLNVDVALPSVMYVTTAPCQACAGLIVNSGVVKCVLYGLPYRSGAGPFRLLDNGVDCRAAAAVDEGTAEKLIQTWSRR